VGEGRTRDARRRLTIDQAADQLGITVDAVRGRVKRGTIAHEREGGRVYVLLDADQPRPGHDQGIGQGASEARPEDRTAELIATLREQLQAERQAHAEARRIIAGLVERVPAIEAPPGSAPQAPDSAMEGEGRGSVPPEPQTTEPPPGWWETLKSMLPSIAGALITATASGFVTILAALNGALLLAGVSLTIAVIAAL
jgi:hypothetical protein